MANKSKFEAIFSIGGKLSGSFKSSIGGATRQMNALGKTIRQAEKGQGGIKRFQALTIGINETKTALDAARVKAADLKKQFSQTVNPTKKLKDQMAAAHKQVDTLSTRLKKQRRDLGGVRSELNAAGVSTRNLSSADATLASRINRARVAQEKLNKAFAKQSRAKSAMGSRAGKTVKAGLATGAMVGAAALPVANSLDFSEGMAKVKAVSNATGPEFQALRSQALELGESTQHSASDAARGMSYLAMAGFKTGQILGAMPGILDLTTASGEELGTTADIGANILSAFGYKAERMGTVGDILTKAFTTSKTTLSGLGETLKYVGPLARSAGISLSTTAAMAGKLGDEGIDSSMAGTSLRSIMSHLAGPVKAGQEAMDALGIETKDQAGNLRDIIDLFEEFAEKTKDMGSGDRLEAYKEIFGAEAASSAAILIKQAGTGALREYSKQLEDSGGVAKKTARVMGDNLKGSFIEVGSAIEGASISFTDVFTPALKAGAKIIAGTVRGTSGWIKEHQTLTKIIAGGTIAIGGAVTVALGLGTAISAVSFAVSGLAVLGPIVGGLTAAFGALSVATLPISGTVLAISAAVGGLGAAAYAVYKNWEPIKNLFVGIKDAVGDFFGGSDAPNAKAQRMAVAGRRGPGPGRGGSNVNQNNSMPITINVNGNGDPQAIANAARNGVYSGALSMRQAMAQERRLAYE